MRLVIALGGNALLKRGERPEPDVQLRHLRVAASALAGLARRHELLLTHGNGPQVGLLALQAGAGDGQVAVPLDVLDAESEGMIGYLIERELMNALPGRELATLLTQVEVVADDPAFRQPSKPIGPVYALVEGERLALQRGWTMARDGEGVRRVVASPAPRRIPGLRAVRCLLDAGFIVVCGGGGGIPVVRDADGALRGVEAVVDKDRTAALLAEGVGANGLVLLTDAPGLYADFGTPGQHLLRVATPDSLRGRPFAAGTMGPKVEAACRFVERTGGWAAIGALEDAAAVVAGTAGTLVEPAAVARVAPSR
jgi:carbamate kinase